MATLIRGKTILTLDPARPVVHDGALLVEGDRIAAIGPYASLRDDPRVERRVGAAGDWVTPGLFNAHHHGQWTFAAGMRDGPLEPFLLRLSALPRLEGERGRRWTYLSTLYNGIRLLRGGVTTTVDMTLAADHHAVIQAYLDLGLDLVYAPMTCSRNGLVYDDDAAFLETLPPELRRRVGGRGLGLMGCYRSARDYLADWSALRADFDRRIQLVVAFDGPQWSEEAEILAFREHAEREGAWIHVHGSESMRETQWALRAHGTTPLGYLERLGLLGPRLCLAHGVWYDEADIDRLARRGASTVHCPSSNLRLGSGIAPVRDCLAKGARIALGIDGHALADDGDALAEMRLAALLQRVPGCPWLEAAEVWAMATEAGARAYGRADQGRLQVGARADVLVFDGAAVEGPYLWPGHDPHEALLVRGKSAHLKAVMGRGRLLMDQGELTAVDEGAIAAELGELCREAWDGDDGERLACVRALEPHVEAFFERWGDPGFTPRHVYNRR